jgi:hypothetical protein
MILHCAACDFSQVPVLLRSGYEDRLRRLGQVPGVRWFSIGWSPRHPARLGFVMAFDSMADLQAYLDHPGHLEVDTFFKDTAVSFTSFDIEREGQVSDVEAP